jgi:uncharacterized protein
MSDTLWFGMEKELENLHLFRYGESYLLYDACSMNFFEVSPELYTHLRAMKKGKSLATLPNKPFQALQEILIKKRATVEVKRRERYQRQISRLGPGRTLGRLTFILTHDCNLRCNYCYAQGGNYGFTARDRMSPQIAQAAIDNVLARFDRIKYIHFFGGEPFLNWPLMEYVGQYFQTLVAQGRTDRMPDFGVTTNGTLCSPQIQRVIREYRIGLTISMDGPREVHDRSRIDAGGHGSFDLIVRNLPKFRACGVPVGVEVTYNRESYKQGYSIWDLVNYFYDLGFQEPHIVYCQYSATDPHRWTWDEEQAIVRYYREATRRSLNTILEGPYRGFTLLSGVLLSLVTKEYNEFTCWAGIGTLAVNVYGTVYPCFMFNGKPDFVLASIHRNLDGLEQQAKHFAESNVKANRRTCHICWARGFCHGCLGGYLTSKGDVNQQDRLHCETLKAIGEEVMGFLNKQSRDPVTWTNFLRKYEQVKLGGRQQQITGVSESEIVS